MPQRIYRIDQLEPFTGVTGESTIWEWIKQGIFPEPIRVGLNTIGWTDRMLERWQEERAAIPYVRKHTTGGRPKGTTKAFLAKRTKRRAKETA